MGISKQELVSMLEVNKLLMSKGAICYLKKFNKISILNCNVNSNYQEEELKSAILVVLANKQDIEGAMSVTEVSNLSKIYFLPIEQINN